VPTTPAETAEAASSPAPAGHGPAISDIRFGEHGGTTRIVFDISALAKFTADLDNDEHVLLITLPNVAWNAKTESTLKASPLIAAYKVTPDGKGGVSLALTLKKNARIASRQSLPAKDGQKPRLVIDIAAA
jgi:hypothetical protein